jgi:hypothetical protein
LTIPTVSLERCPGSARRFTVTRRLKGAHQFHLAKAGLNRAAEKWFQLSSGLLPSVKEQAMNFSRTFRFVVALSLAVAWFGAPLGVNAQPGTFQPGDKIEYRESSYSEVWEPGVYVGATPNGKQPIIRKKPNEFYKDGAQTAYQWEWIRLPTAKPVAKPPVEAPAKAATTAAPAVVPHAPEPTATPAALAHPIAAAGPPLSKEAILGFLQKNLGAQPFAHPRFQEIKRELADMIKRRGVNFRYENLSDFSNQLGKFGASSEIIFPLQSNFGPPTRQDWLMSKWGLSKIGATVDYKGNDGYIYRQTEIGVKDVGGLTITADGKYVWNIDVPRGVARGDWRKATPEEMRYQGGDAIVLLKAKGGVDWIVHQDRVTQLKGDWINIAQLDSRQVREGGFREAKGK